MDIIPMKCKTKEQYKTFYTKSNNFKYKKLIIPCDQLTIRYETETRKTRKSNRIKRIMITMKYFDVNNYKLILNKQEFGWESLWSQIGGFIGIFLGYSLLQVPEILSNTFGRLKTIFNNKRNPRPPPESNEESIVNTLTRTEVTYLDIRNP